MKNLFIICALGFVFTTNCSSSKKLATIKPDQTQVADEFITHHESSFINIPVTIQIKDIEALTNNNLTGLIYDDTSFDKDDLKLKIWKEAPIKITYDNGKIKTIFPMKAQVFYRIGTNKLGIDLYDIREFNLRGTVTLLSDVGLTNWHLKTNTRLVSLEWKEHPTMKLFGQNIVITNVIIPAIALFKDEIVESIDDALAESMNFKPQVLDALETICKPFQMSETYESWLRIVPEELYTTDATLTKTDVRFTMGMKCQMETIVGVEPLPKFDRNKIVLKPVKDIPNRVTTSIVAMSSYEDASRLMNTNFKGQTFGSGSKQVSVEQVELWQNNQKLIIGLTLKGAVNGTIYLSGYPQYNAVTQEVYLDQLDYVLDTKSVIAKTANWLASKSILLQLQQYCRYSIKPNLDEGKANILKYLDNYTVMPGVFVNGKLGEIKFQNIYLTHKAIAALIELDGNVAISVKGIE